MSYSHQRGYNEPNYKVISRILILIVVLTVVAAGVFGLKYADSASKAAGTRAQLVTRIRSNCSNAKLLADKLPNSVQQDTATKLSQIRQYVYAMGQLNDMAIAVGGESARVVSEEAMTALNQDLEEYFAITQSNTTSVL